MKNFAAVGPKWLLRRRGPAAVEVTLEDGHYMRRHFDHIHAYLGTNSPIVPVVQEKGVVPADEEFWYEGHAQPQWEPQSSQHKTVLFDPMMASLLESGHETEIQMNPLSRSKPRSATSGRPLNLKPVLRDEKKQKTKDAPNESIKSKEEEFRRLNAELEAKTATLVKEAEELMKEHNSVLSDTTAETDVMGPVLQSPDHVLQLSQQLNPALGAFMGHTICGLMGRTKRKHASEDPQSPPIAERIQSEVKKAVEQLENELDVSCTAASVVYDVNDILPEAAEEMGAEATIRFLKAKLRVMQEEMDRLYAKNNEHEKEIGDLKLKLKTYGTEFKASELHTNS
eukprot:Em0010g749a